jgi:hypothetical protein
MVRNGRFSAWADFRVHSQKLKLHAAEQATFPSSSANCAVPIEECAIEGRLNLWCDGSKIYSKSIFFWLKNPLFSEEVYGNVTLFEENTFLSQKNIKK